MHLNLGFLLYSLRVIWSSYHNLVGCLDSLNRSPLLGLCLLCLFLFEFDLVLTLGRIQHLLHLLQISVNTWLEVPLVCLVNEIHRFLPVHRVEFVDLFD